MAMNGVGDVLAISISIKFVIAAVFTILEEKRYISNRRVENSLLVLITAIISFMLYSLHTVSYDGAFNIFFYTLGIDNITNYAKLGVHDVIEHINKKANGEQTN